MRIEGKLIKIFDIETGISKAGKEWKKTINTYRTTN